MTPGRSFYERQVDFLARRDVDGLITGQYHPDAVLISFDTVVHGDAALREHFKNYLGYLGYIKLMSTDKFAEIDDAIFFEATVETQLGIAEVYDVFMLKDGKATRHFTGLKSVRPKSS